MNTVRQTEVVPGWTRLVVLGAFFALLFAATWIVVARLEYGQVGPQAAQTSALSASDAGKSGMGELRRFEAEGSLTAAAGMGNFRRFEADQAGPKVAGMGDLRRFEAGQGNANRAGMGELRRLEAGHGH